MIFLRNSLLQIIDYKFSLKYFFKNYLNTYSLFINVASFIRIPAQPIASADWVESRYENLNVIRSVWLCDRRPVVWYCIRVILDYLRTLAKFCNNFLLICSIVVDVRICIVNCNLHEQSRADKC